MSVYMEKAIRRAIAIFRKEGIILSDDFINEMRIKNGLPPTINNKILIIKRNGVYGGQR